MVISDAEKKILLERLQKAREVKAAKAAAAKKTPVPKKEAIPAPIIEPTPVPEVLKDAVKDLPPLEPPNLLAMVAKVDDTSLDVVGHASHPPLLDSRKQAYSAAEKSCGGKSVAE
jgi:hypothetical protein